MNKLGVSVVIVCCAALTACRTSKEGFVAKGNKLFAAGRYADAELQYLNATRKDTVYGEAYYRLGLTEVKLQKPAAAQRALLRAVQLLPNNIDAKEQLGALMLEYYMLDSQHSHSYYSVVKEMSDELLEKNPNSVEGLREKAMLALEDRKPDEALALLRKAVQIKPDNAVVTTTLAMLLAKNGQAQSAEALLQGIIARQPAYGGAYDSLYQMYSSSKRPVDAENIIKAKVANNPKQGDYILELASHYERTNKRPEMVAALQKLLDDPKDFPQARLWVGDFYMKIRDYPEAVRYYQEGARTDSQPEQQAIYNKRTVNALLTEGKVPEATHMVDRILQDNPNDDEALRVKANLLLRTGKQENVKTAHNELADLSKRRPDDASVWMGLGRTELLEGDLDAARTQYLQAVQKHKDFLPARYALAEIGLIQQHPQETLAQANEILKLRPNDRRARMLRAQALARSGNPSLARAELTALTKEDGRDVQPQFELAMLDFSERQYAQAEEIFTKLRATGDDRAPAGLATCYSAQKQFDKALQVLEEGLKKSPDSTLLRRQMASTAATAGQYDRSIAEFSKLVALYPKSIEDRLALGDVYVAKGNLTDAIAMYREAYSLHPTNLTAGLVLARTLANAGKNQEATTQYEAVLKAHPNDAGVLNDMAYFLVEHNGDVDEALRLAQRAIQQAPQQPSYSDTIACIYLKKGQRDSALQIFSNLVRKYPDFATFRYHLGMALFENGDKGRARRELQTALASHPSPQDELRIKELLGKIG